LLKFAVDFVRTDLKTCTESELGDLRNEIREFLDAGSPGGNTGGLVWVSRIEGLRGRPASRTRIRSLQIATERLLRGVVGNRDRGGGRVPSLVFARLRFLPLVGSGRHRFDIEEVQARPKVPRDRVILQVTGPLQHVFLYQLLCLLARMPLNPVRICAAADCGNLFFAPRKGLYCQSRCQQRISQRERREVETREPWPEK
jgi:hypothetical protein